MIGMDDIDTIMEMLSDDEDEFMEVDPIDSYMSNDENLLTDDEDDEIIRILTESHIPTPAFNSNAMPPAFSSQSCQPTNNSFMIPMSKASLSNTKSYLPTATPMPSADIQRLMNQFTLNTRLDEIEDLVTVRFNVQKFPKEHHFLLDLPAINEKTLRNYPKFFDLVFTKQTEASKLIEKEIATVSMYWAQAILDCQRPLLRQVQLQYVERKDYPSRTCKNQTITRIVFSVKYSKENFASGGRSSFGRSVKPGMFVFVQQENTHISQRQLARVTRVEGNVCQLTVRCLSDKAEACIEICGNPVSIYEILQEFLPVAMLHSIESMESGLFNHIVEPKPFFNETHDDYLRRKSAQIDEFMLKYKASNKLTNAQKDVIFAIANNEHKEWPFVLNGPPGTGKTFTISQAIQIVLLKDPEAKILVCTPSNMAADRVAEQLMRDFGEVLNSTNVLRLKAPGNPYHSRDRAFDRITFRNPDAEMFDIPKNFDQWRVVVSTLGCSSHLTKQEGVRGMFSHIMIDEAGQSTEAELWIPLGCLMTRNTSIILCGDPKQLGPVITLDLSKPLQAKFESSLIRYMSMREYQQDKRLSCQLVDCFRCPISVIDIVSPTFYDNILVPANQFRTNDLHFSELEIRPGFPILFVSVEGSEQVEDRGTSICNMVEADIVVDYVDFLINTKGMSPDKIGVISPYTYQTRMIIEKLRKKGRKKSREIEKVIVNSVERFQGSERDVIIMTTTRTTRHMGFMADELRINTSLTRAKHLLIVIGSEAALHFNRAWKSFIDYCHTNKAVKYWDELNDPKFNESDLYIIDELNKMNIG